MELSALRAWWWHRQGLDGSLRGALPGRGVGAVRLGPLGRRRQPVPVSAVREGPHQPGTGRRGGPGPRRSMNCQPPGAAPMSLPAQHFGLGLQVGSGRSRGRAEGPGEAGRGPAREVDALRARGADPSSAVAPRRLTRPSSSGNWATGCATWARRGAHVAHPRHFRPRSGCCRRPGRSAAYPRTAGSTSSGTRTCGGSPPTTDLSDAGARTELARLYFDWTAPATLAPLPVVPRPSPRRTPRPRSPNSIWSIWAAAC